MITEKHMEAIWKKMARIYGHKWVSNYGARDDGTWFSAIQKFPEESVMRGLEKCLLRPDPWPPSLPEFCQMCLDIPDVGTVVNKLLNQDYSDSMSLAIKKKIGSWNLQNQTTKEIRQQVMALYESTYLEIVSTCSDNKTMIQSMTNREALR